MELIDQTLRIDIFLAVTFGIVVLFVGKRLNAGIGFLRDFSIPEPVSGGLLFSLLFAALYAVSGIGVAFDLAARDVLLVYSLPRSASMPVSGTCSPAAGRWPCCSPSRSCTWSCRTASGSRSPNSSGRRAKSA